MIDSKSAEMSAQNDANPTTAPPPAYPPPENSYPQTQSPSAQGPAVMQPPPVQQTRSAAQIGEQYRAELYAQCAQGKHERTTKYGVCGIITAVVCFPIGLICLFMDTDEVCSRCGVTLS